MKLSTVSASKMIIVVATIPLLVMSLSQSANAEIKSITASHIYTMGDNDSKNDARRMCFLEAKRKVLEKAGSYIESRTEVRNFRLTKDEISTYSAALLKVDTVNEEWKLRGENMGTMGDVLYF